MSTFTSPRPPSSLPGADRHPDQPSIPVAAMTPAVALHPENPRYFLFRGRPLVLIAATEHYGSVINRAFDFVRYLEEAAQGQQTMTRTFLLFRELQSTRNPSSPCKPESPDYLAPYPRSGPGTAMDGEPRFDLERWNPEYFERLHRFLGLASRLGIVVELTLFSNSYHEGVWQLNPLRKDNNLQGVGEGDWTGYTTTADARRFAVQCAYTRKIVAETAAYDNVIYEVCNEPGGDLPSHATVADVDQWQREIAATIRDECRRLGRPHLVVGSQAFTYTPRMSAAQSLDASFAESTFDAVNVHPLPDVTFHHCTYQIGEFMSKQLTLRAMRDFCLAAASITKPCIHDEDNVASLYRDETGWTIHRKRSWTAVFAGAHYDYIDFSLTVGSETGTPASRAGIRAAMRHLTDIMASIDVVRYQPMIGVIGGLPPEVLDAGLVKAGEDYLIYLADQRELGEPGAGQPISASATMVLPDGQYALSALAPATGQWSPAMGLTASGQPVAFRLPSFRHDLLLRLTRQP